MRLIAKINIIVTLAFVLGLVLSAQLLWLRYVDAARDEALQSGRIMLAASGGVKDFVGHEVAPLPRLLGSGQIFVQAAVPFYAAAQVFKSLHAEFPGYSVRNVAMNPTNPDDKPDADEQAIIERFTNDTSLEEFVTQTGSGDGALIRLAHPIRVEQECLPCHSTPEAAPPAMVGLYGREAGFNWKLGSIVGAEIISVPVKATLDRARGAFKTMIAIFASVFVVVLILLNVILLFLVIRPIKRIARTAEDVSLGKPDVPAFEYKGKDEIGVLSRAFNRMRRSLESALQMIED